MLVDDAVLPAAAHLTGPQAERLLGAAVGASGGTLERARPCHVQYRPGHDVVVRFDSRVRWGSRAAVDETLVAATTATGPPPGSLPVEAVTADGETLTVGVWRWPFDPVVTGLAAAVTPSSAGAFLDGLIAGPVRLEVVAYRPTLRAVVRVVDSVGAVLYLKALPPADVDDPVDRHRRMLAAGVPVPVIVRHDVGRGLVAMAELPGPTIRERIKRGDRRLPAADQYEAIYAALATVSLASSRPVDGRATTALRHGAMLASVLPGVRTRLEQVTELLAPAAARALDRAGATIHGDLYEAQLVTGRGAGRTDRIVGVLDLDDAGPGDPLDDRATVIAHLVNRAIDAQCDTARRVAGYAGSLRREFWATVDPVELDLVTAGALLGLATGPFRLQQRRWPHAVRRRLAVVEHLARRPGEKTLSITS